MMTPEQEAYYWHLMQQYDIQTAFRYAQLVSKPDYWQSFSDEDEKKLKQSVLKHLEKRKTLSTGLARTFTRHLRKISSSSIALLFKEIALENPNIQVSKNNRGTLTLKLT